MGKAKKAEALWMDIYKKNPYSYYGIISRLKLNKPFEPFDRSPMSSQIKNKESKLIDFFISTDELKLAKKFLSARKKCFCCQPISSPSDV